MFSSRNISHSSSRSQNDFLSTTNSQLLRSQAAVTSQGHRLTPESKWSRRQDLKLIPESSMKRSQWWLFDSPESYFWLTHMPCILRRQIKSTKLKETPELQTILHYDQTVWVLLLESSNFSESNDPFETIATRKTPNSQ